MVTTILNYCSYDYRFLSACIEECRHFSDEIIVAVSDHFFDGTKEDPILLSNAYHRNRVKFIEFAYDHEKPYGLYPQVSPSNSDWAHHWHSTSRYVGYHFVRPESEHVLFLDADEVPDGKRFADWLATGMHREYNALRFDCHFYFRSSSWRAKTLTRNGLLVKKSALAPEIILDLSERMGTYEAMAGPKIEGVMGLDGEVLFHHYSWVKTEQELRRKVESWGHREERDWRALIDEEFKRPFEGKEKLWNLAYEKVLPLCDPLQVELPTQAVEGPFDHVIKVDRLQLLINGV